MSYEAVMAKVLAGTGVEVPVSFETIGHIAHMNLRDHHAPYRAVIGEVLLDKVKHLRTVISKRGEIASVFRTFEYDLLAGSPDTVVSITHNGCRFSFDYAKVYWNTRLETEHKRMSDSFAPGQVIADVFAGVGPFALPAAKRGCFVLANDLNPESHAALVANMARNKLEKKRAPADPLHPVTPFNMDGREFCRHVAGMVERGECPKVDHVLMNLPASAVTFLDTVVECFGPETTVHCYMFAVSPDEKYEEVARAMVAEVVKVPITVHGIFDVRDVSPQKHMMRFSFSVRDPKVGEKRKLTEKE